MAYLDNKLQTYNPRAYVPGGSTKRVASAIQAKGRKKPPKNPYTRPQPGGGSGAVSTNAPGSPSSSLNQAGVNAQLRDAAARMPVSTTLDVNYESDPVLARIRALNSQSVGDAEANATALRKQAVIDTGLTDVGREIGLDDSTLQAAAANPLSVSATLQREAALRGQQLDESLNAQNLFYSGYRGTQLAQLAQSQLEEQANLARDLRSALGGIDQGVLEARNAAALEEQAAIEEAAARAQQAAQDQAMQDALAMALDPMSFLSPPASPDQVYGADFSSVNDFMNTLTPTLTPEEELAMALQGGGGWAENWQYM